MPTSLRITEKDYEKFEWVRYIILQDVAVHHTITWLSEQSGLNEYKLKIGFKMLYGQALFEFLETERLKRAVNLLTTTDDPIRVVGLQCGYAHSTNFIAAFRRTFKMTPLDYRREKLSIVDTRISKNNCLQSPVADLFPSQALIVAHS